MVRLADGGALVLTNSSVACERPGETYHLPDLVLAGTSAVETATMDHSSTWKTVRKVTNETAKWRSLAGAKKLFVEEGRLDVSNVYDKARFAGLISYISTNVPVGTTFAEFKERATNVTYNCKTTGAYLSWNIDSTANLPTGGAMGYEGWIWWDGEDGDEWTFVAASGATLIYCAINGEILYNCDNLGWYHRKLDTFADLDAKKVNVKHGWNKFEAFTRKGWSGMANDRPDGAISWPDGKSLNVNYAGGESVNPSDYVLICDKETDATNGKDLTCETGDATLDGHPWVAQFGEISVAAGATLAIADDAPAFGSLGGTGSLVGNVTASNVTASAANLSGALTVAGNVTLEDGAVVVVSDARQLRRVRNLPILTVTGTLTAPQKIVCTSDDGNFRFKASISSDGKSLLLTARGAGVGLLLR